jgi:hypothetical protein
MEAWQIVIQKPSLVPYTPDRNITENLYNFYDNEKFSLIVAKVVLVLSVRKIQQF